MHLSSARKENNGNNNVYIHVKAQFVAAGMCAGICVYDTGGGNPHAHVMLTMRPFDENGEWGAKQKKEYILNREDGNKIYDRKKCQYKCKSVPATDWNDQTKAGEWWAACHAEKAHRAIGHLFQVQGKKEADRSRTNPVYGGVGLSGRRD